LWAGWSRNDGMSKFQYKVGVDVNQTIWEGRPNCCTRRSQNANWSIASPNEVNLYVVKKRVNDFIFQCVAYWWKDSKYIAICSLFC
jgi:hypothetical protein